MDKQQALQELQLRLTQRKFETFSPYPWQEEVLAGGKDKLQRMVMAGNRTGKTYVAAYEVACHLTGRYPDWWEGRRFLHAPLVWASSLTNETLKDIIQLELLGKWGQFGTGLIPKDTIVDWEVRQAGIKNVVDVVRIKHVSGDVSTLKTKVAEQGWEKYQGTAPDMVWQDEEPADYRVVSESLMRLMTTDGIFLVTFTPLRGETEIVQHFIDQDEDSALYTATWDDSPHLTDDVKAKFLAKLPKHERDARTKGIPMMGEGMVFPIADEDILCTPFKIPDHYPRLAAVDFGINHYAAGVWMAIDPDSDTVYLTDAYRKKGELPPFHASAIKRRDPDNFIPVMWPHDGVNDEKGTGKNVAESYKTEGVRMFQFSARYDDTVGSTQKIEPVVQDMYQRMESGTFKVFDNVGGQLFLSEKRGLHRKDNKIVAINDDVFAASRYCLMMKRYAMPKYLRARAAPMSSAPLFSSSKAQ